MVDYSSQEQMLFLNICQDKSDEDGICFTRETVDHFWDDHTSQYIFVDDTMLNEIGMDEDAQQKYISSFGWQYCDLKYTELREQLEKMNSIEETYEYEEKIEILKSAYSESYADLQMILVLAMRAEDYLSTIFVKQNVACTDILSDAESVFRVSTIYRVMTNCGIWEREKCAQSAVFDEIRVCLEAYNQEVSKEIGEEEHYAEKESILHIGKLFSEFDFTNGIQFKQSLADRQEQKVDLNTEMEDAAFVPDAVNGLYEYLLEVMRASLEEYIKPEKQKMIREVRNVVNKILTFEDTAEVFNCIEEELSIYKREGCKIQDSVF